jgi:amino acid permease
MSGMKIRPVTIVLLVVAAVFVIIGIVYAVDTATHLPSFFPGHTAGATKHHYKHALAAFLVAAAALAGAWMTTSPARDSTS